jgi:hypothetical protein
MRAVTSTLVARSVMEARHAEADRARRARDGGGLETQPEPPPQLAQPWRLSALRSFAAAIRRLDFTR